jgi:hypothetical protein
MKDMDWKIALVIRTIGAERGRAARGRPDETCWMRPSL